MQYNTEAWSRDWEHFNQSGTGRNKAEGLSDDELVEYLRWMACNRPGRYADIMTAFVKTQEQQSRIGVAV